MEGPQTAWDPAVDGERRAPEPLLYTRDQVLGRRPIRLRRASDKRRLAAHVLLAVALVSFAAWLIVPAHAFAGPVIWSITRDHGVHAGDLPSLPSVALAGWSLLRARALVLARA